MRNPTKTISLIVAMATGFKASAAPETAPNPSQMQAVKEFNFQKVQKASLKYLLFLPKGYEPSASKRWPLMLFLHGAGERGNNIWKVTAHGPPKNVAQNPDFPFIVASPQCPDGQIWSNDILLGLLDELTTSLRVDTKRVYLTGLSMGGYGTWDLGICHPERFAAIAPICGGGDLINVLLSEGPKREALKTLGIWAFHGAKDPVVPPEESQRMVDVLKKNGVEDVRLTIYPEAGHDAWTETYNNPELYQWLLKHERK